VKSKKNGHRPTRTGERGGKKAVGSDEKKNRTKVVQGRSEAITTKERADERKLGNLASLTKKKSDKGVWPKFTE